MYCHAHWVISIGSSSPTDDMEELGQTRKWTLLHVNALSPCFAVNKRAFTNFDYMWEMRGTSDARFRNHWDFCWNWNQNQENKKVLELEPESESENLVLESESESGILNLVTSLSIGSLFKTMAGYGSLEMEPESRFLGWNWNRNGISGLLAGILIGTGIRLFRVGQCNNFTRIFRTLRLWQ